MSYCARWRSHASDSDKVLVHYGSCNVSSKQVNVWRGVITLVDLFQKSELSDFLHTRQRSRTPVVTMALIDALTDLRSHLDCSVCLETLSSPKLLPCGHRFCKECLDGIELFHRIRCPLCNEVTQKRVDDLPNDTLVTTIEDDLVDKLERARHQSCTVCPHKKARKRCLNCKSSLCIDCNMKHSRVYGAENGQNHIVTNFDPKLLCSDHGRDRVYLCEECHQTVCSSCLLQGCLGHKYTTVENALKKYLSTRTFAEKKTQFIRTHSEILKEHIGGPFEETIRDIQNRYSHIDLTIQQETNTLIDNLKKLQDDATHILNVTKSAADGLNNFKQIPSKSFQREVPEGLLHKLPEMLRPEVQDSYDSYIVEDVEFEPNINISIGTVCLTLAKPESNGSGACQPRLYGNQQLHAHTQFGGDKEKLKLTLKADNSNKNTIANFFAMARRWSEVVMDNMEKSPQGCYKCNAMGPSLWNYERHRQWISIT